MNALLVKREAGSLCVCVCVRACVRAVPMKNGAQSRRPGHDTFVILVLWKLPGLKRASCS